MYTVPRICPEYVEYVDNLLQNNIAVLNMKVIKRISLICALFFVTVNSSYAIDVETYRNNQLGFEISYLSNWAKSKYPDNPPFFIKRNSSTDVGTISVRVRNFTGDEESFMNEMRTTTNIIISELQQRFPDAELGEHGDTYLGGFPAYLITTSYTIKNINIEIDVVAWKIFCIKGKRIYLVSFETTLQAFEKTFPEFEKILATFNFR